MVIDSSALLAILQNEQTHDRLVAAIVADGIRVLSSATFLETSMVAHARRGPEGVKSLDGLLSLLGLVVLPVDRAQAELARDAFAGFGKGQHPAALNFGDCFVYALAQSTGEPVLCTGDDFRQTDLRCLP